MQWRTGSRFTKRFRETYAKEPDNWIRRRDGRAQQVETDAVHSDDQHVA
jgi:hypothetical protein